jgi:hypothetical protein
MKKCRVCGIEKPLTEFHKTKSSKDGHRSICKTCAKQKRAEYLACPKVKERIRQTEARYRARPEVKERRNQQSREWNAQNKERIKRHRSLPEVKEKIKQTEARWKARPEVKERRRQQRAKRRARPEVKEQEAQYKRQKAAEQPACVYEIKNLLNKKTYIGQTTRGELRWKEHLIRLRGSRHQNHDLQQDFNKHGEEILEWSIIKELPKDKDILLLEEARELERRINRGEELYNMVLTIEQIKMLKENKEVV